MKIKNKEMAYYGVKLFLVIIVPCILFSLIFLPTYYKLVKDQNTYMWTIKDPDPSFFFMVQNMFENSFDIKWYNFCFSSKKTFMYADFPDIQKRVDFPLNLTLKLLLPDGNWQEQEIMQNLTYCTKVNLKYPFQYNVEWGSSFNNTEETVNHTANIIFKPDFYQNIEPEKWSLLTKFALITLSWWALLLLFTGIINFVGFGINKKQK